MWHHIAGSAEGTVISHLASFTIIKLYYLYRSNKIVSHDILAFYISKQLRSLNCQFWSILLNYMRMLWNQTTSYFNTGITTDSRSIAVASLIGAYYFSVLNSWISVAKLSLSIQRGILHPLHKVSHHSLNWNTVQPISKLILASTDSRVNSSFSRAIYLHSRAW